MSFEIVSAVWMKLKTRSEKTEFLFNPVIDSLDNMWTHYIAANLFVLSLM